LDPDLILQRSLRCLKTTSAEVDRMPRIRQKCINFNSGVRFVSSATPCPLVVRRSGHVSGNGDKHVARSD